MNRLSKFALLDYSSLTVIGQENLIDFFWPRMLCNVKNIATRYVRTTAFGCPIERSSTRVEI
jgi:hypothetical protein